MTLLKADHRSPDSKVDKLRKIGYIPAIIYGKSMSEPMLIQVDALRAMQFLSATTINDQALLRIDGRDYPCLLKEVSLHPNTNRLQHLDFQLLP